MPGYADELAALEPGARSRRKAAMVVSAAAKGYVRGRLTWEHAGHTLSVRAIHVNSGGNVECTVSMDGVELPEPRNPFVFVNPPLSTVVDNTAVEDPLSAFKSIVTKAVQAEL
jgi:hypothetical protein